MSSLNTEEDEVWGQYKPNYIALVKAYDVLTNPMFY